MQEEHSLDKCFMNAKITKGNQKEIGDGLLVNTDKGFTLPSLLGSPKASH